MRNGVVTKIDFVDQFCIFVCFLKTDTVSHYFPLRSRFLTISLLTVGIKKDIILGFFYFCENLK